jgi:hypothetical protein
MAQYLIEVPDDVAEEAVRHAAAQLGGSVRWVAVDDQEEHENEWMFTDESAWETLTNYVSGAMRDIHDEEATQDPTRPRSGWPYYPYEEWTTEHKRKLIVMAVTRWEHLSPNGVRNELLKDDYEAGLMEAFRGPPASRSLFEYGDTTTGGAKQAATPRPEFRIFDNGVAIYEDEGGTILQRYAEQKGHSTTGIPDWNSLSQETRLRLMYMAAESPRWQSQGHLDEYRMEEFEEGNGDIFDEK